MGSDVVHSILPSVKGGAAKPTSRNDLRDGALPLIHPCTQFRVVHQSKVLIEVILSVKCSFLDGFLLASAKVVSFQMVLVWINLSAKGAQ
jgi:hypothetical protein